MRNNNKQQQKNKSKSNLSKLTQIHKEGTIH